jgi:ABC-type multidrug transport system fused ATPase/permease subunit
MRRGLTDLDGEGDVVAGIVVMRYGENALTTIEAVKAKFEELQPSLPAGTRIVSLYDRSHLIQEAVGHLGWKLAEEMLIVALVCALFLFHARSALIAIFTLPVALLAAFLVMRLQGIGADHHEPGRNGHRDRGDGRRGHHPGGERAQASGTRTGKAPRGDASRAAGAWSWKARWKWDHPCSGRCF